MTEQEKIEEIRNNNNLAARVYDNMVVYYDHEGNVYAIHNAEECPNHNPNEEVFATHYIYSGIVMKVCQPDAIVAIITKLGQVKREFIKWLERPDKTAANCPVTYADVFVNELFEYDDEEQILDDEPDYDEDPYYDDEPDYDYEPDCDDDEPCRACGVGLTSGVVKMGIFLCLNAIAELIYAIDREFARRNH